MKKLFTTILLMGVALCSWASYTAEYVEGTKTLTINYVDDGNSNLNVNDLIKEHMRKAETIVLTGDWANKDLQNIGDLVKRCIIENGPDANPKKTVFLDLSACEGFRSSVVSTTGDSIDWTSNNYICLPNSNYPETVNRTGTATRKQYYYLYGNLWNGTPVYNPNDEKWYANNQYNSWEVITLGDYYYVDENGNEIPSSSVTVNNGTYTYSFTETLDSTPFSLAGNDFHNNAKYLKGIAFPNSENFTAIPDNLFGDDGAPKFDGQQYASLDSISLGSNIIYIGGFSFKNSQVKYVNFPVGLKAIGPEAFDNAPLKKVDLSGCTSLVAIKYEAFEFCSQLKTLKFPSGSNFTFLGNDAFKQTAIDTLDMSMCYGITEFQSSNGAYKTFLQCRDLKVVILPPYLTAIPDDTGNGVFHDCTAMDSLVFTGSAEYIGCELQNGVYIGKNAFNFGQVHGEGENQTVELSSLRSITLSNNVEFIEFQAFYAAAITEIHIPASVDSLAKHCFYGCQNLKTVYFDEFNACDSCDCVGAATKVAGEKGAGGQGQGAFEECQHITDVYINTMADLNCTNNAFDQDITWGAGDAGANFATLHYPKEKIEHYVNLKHYLTDEIVTDQGLFHDWLEDHYKQAIIPHKNGWYEFINSGPMEPGDSIGTQDIILRTFSDWNYAYLVPQGIRAYVVNNIEKVESNYEVSLQRINVIPKRTGVILYGHPNGRNQNGRPTLVLTPVKFLEYGDSIFKVQGDEQVFDSIYTGPSQGAALCRANWGNLDEAHMMYKNYLEPINNATGARVDIKPYETVSVNGQKLITFRNFGLGRYTSTDTYRKNTSTLNDETNFVGFFRMKPQSYKSGYAYLRLRGDVDEEGNALPYTNPVTKEEYVSEFPIPDGGEILVKPDEPAVDETHHVYPYYWEVMIKDGIPYDARAKAAPTAEGHDTYNPKGWWDDDLQRQPIPFTWREYTLSWGNRSAALKNPSNSAKYFGELEENADGVVKIVIPASNEDDAYYTLEGVRVTNPTTKGVYIHNGKKVIIK